MQLRPFQRRFLKGALAPEISTAALSLPRGNGKSWLAGFVVSRILDPTDSLFRPGTESVLCAANVEQARIVFRFARETLEPAARTVSSTPFRGSALPTSKRIRAFGLSARRENQPWTRRLPMGDL